MSEKKWALWDEAARRLEPSIAAVVARALSAARQEISETALVALLALGDPELVVNAILSVFTGELDARLPEALREMLADSGAFAATQIPPGVRVAFDVGNPLVTRWLRGYSLGLIKQITTETREGIRAYLLEGLRLGVNPRETARHIRGIIGLTQQQSKAVFNYRMELEARDSNALRRMLRDRRFDPTVRAVVQGKANLTSAQIDTMVTRYQQRFLKFRSEMIAREESMRALHAGNRMAWQQVFLANKAQPANIRRYWYTAKDERVCEICAPIPGMNPDGRGFDEEFDTPDGPMIGPTAHIMCRCVVFTSVEG